MLVAVSVGLAVAVAVSVGLDVLVAVSVGLDVAVSVGTGRARRCVRWTSRRCVGWSKRRPIAVYVGVSLRRRRLHLLQRYLQLFNLLIRAKVTTLAHRTRRPHLVHRRQRDELPASIAGLPSLQGMVSRRIRQGGQIYRAVCAAQCRRATVPSSM